MMADGRREKKREREREGERKREKKKRNMLIVNSTCYG